MSAMKVLSPVIPMPPVLILMAPTVASVNWISQEMDRCALVSLIHKYIIFSAYNIHTTLDMRIYPKICILA